VLLIGDAAHAMSPNMAQGAAMAFEDALVLAESLAAADTGTAAINAHQRRRRPRIDWILNQTRRRDRARQLFHDYLLDGMRRCDMPGCDATFSEDSKATLMEQIVGHAAAVDGITEITPEVATAVGASIKES
jgi:flavin-dependent dehydrogenase